MTTTTRPPQTVSKTALSLDEILMALFAQDAQELVSVIQELAADLINLPSTFERELIALEKHIP